MHSLETKLIVIKGAICASRRMSFFYDEQYCEVYPHLLVTRDGFWRLFGVQIVSDTGEGSPAKPHWLCLEVEDITGQITIFAVNEPLWPRG